jgi:hypothetical protein
MTMEEKKKLIRQHCNGNICSSCILGDLIADDGKCTIDTDITRINERVKRILEEHNTKPDLVHHPAHYCYSKYEPKDVIRAWELNFNLGSAVKYIARAGRKDDILQELNKAKQFLEFEIEAIELERSEK